MIEDTIGQIEAQIRNSGGVNEERKGELLQLLARLKAEVVRLEQTHDQEARTIAERAHASAQEATEPGPNPESLQQSVQGLRSSVEGFEKSHPQLVEIVNGISNLLSNLGI